MNREIDQLLVRRTDPLLRAIQRIDKGGCGIAVVVDEQRRLISTITDGDVRRAILANRSLETSVAEFLEWGRTTLAHREPYAARAGTDQQELLRLMTAWSIRQLPLLDEGDAVVDLALLDELVPVPPETGLQAVVMAGGFGTRLLPLTQDLPKPMLPVGGRPVLEHIIAQLQQAGIRNVNVSTHYHPEKIIDHFGDGEAFGVKLKYVNEAQPLGTGGALGLLSRPSETQLVINGDILTQVDFGAMLSFHRAHTADMTVAVRRHEVQIPYGVIECDGTRVTRLAEKPMVPFLVNAGVYLLEPSVYEYITSGERFNMTDLIDWLLGAGRTVISFPIHEYWTDIGQHDDYERAQADNARRSEPGA